MYTSSSFRLLEVFIGSGTAPLGNNYVTEINERQ